MNAFLYKLLILTSKIFGIWVLTFTSRLIAAGYYIFFPVRVATGVKFYKALFPRQNIRHYLGCVWKQFESFTSVFLDRLVGAFGEISYTMAGWEDLTASLKRKKGALILMSHFGNWDVAAHLFKSEAKDFPLLLYMGRRAKDKIEDLQKNDLAQNGIRIIAQDEQNCSPFEIVEAINFLKSGGVVSLSSDIAWRKDHRAVPVKFLGHEIRLPETPYLMALFSGAPLFVFFPFRTGKRKYNFTLTGPLFVTAASRNQRPAAIQKVAQHYADLLEKAVRRSPFEWYHFEKFIGSKLVDS